MSIDQSPTVPIRADVIGLAHKRRNWGVLSRQIALGYGLVFPSLLILTLFTYGPAILVVLISFSHWVPGGPLGVDWVGTLHYQQLLNPISGFLESLSVTAYYIGVMVPATVIIGLALAWLLRGSQKHKTPGLTFFRAAVFLPYVTPAVATSIVWVFIFNPQYGLANAVLTFLHLPQLQWLTDPGWAMPAVMINNLWHNVGFSVVLFLAGISNVPYETIEAAQLDGASSTKVFRHVVLPFISPVMLFVVIITTIGAMQTFGSIYTMTGGQTGGGGGPLASTTTTAIYLYKSAFVFFHYSYAAAVSVVLFILILGLTLIQRAVGEKFTFYQ